MTNMISSFLHPERGYQDANQQMQQFYNQAQGYQQPFMNQGQQAYGDLYSAMKALLDPEKLQSEWTEGYETSPAAIQAKDLAEQSGLNAASAMGLMGSRPALDAIHTGSSNISLADRQNYLNDLMLKYMQGAGVAGGIYNTGANAATNLSQNAMNMGQNSAQLAFGEENAPGDMFSNLLGGAIGLLGTALGGPIGGAAGSAIGGALSKNWNLAGG